MSDQAIRKAPISAVLFDLDGTLVDTAPDFYRAIAQMREERGLTPLPYDLIRNTVSNGAAALIDIAFELPREEPLFAELNQQLLDYYLRDIGLHSSLFDQLDILLDWLDKQQIPWGIVTNKPERFTTPLLVRLNLTERCSTVICPDHVTNRKPDPEGLLLACKEINRPANSTIYVGDHQRDIEAGRRAGMQTIAAKFGYLDKDDNPEAWQADFIAENEQDILSWLKQNHHDSI